MVTADWTGSWLLDPDRTDLAFHSPTFWGLAHVKGRFAKVAGAGTAASPDLISGHLEIDAASVSTGIGKRDAHIRSADFLDAQEFPIIAATVESADATEPGWVTLHTTVTVKRSRQAFDLPTHVQTLTDGAVQLTTTATLNRRTFGVDGNLFAMMGDGVTIEATAVFVRQL